MGRYIKATGDNPTEGKTGGHKKPKEGLDSVCIRRGGSYMSLGYVAAIQEQSRLLASSKDDDLITLCVHRKRME